MELFNIAIRCSFWWNIRE